MTIETGTAVDVFDLLDKIEIFAGTTLGWTVNKTTADELYLQKGTAYFNLKAGNDLRAIALTVDGASRPITMTSNFAAPGIACVGSRGFDGGLAWHSQPSACLLEAGLGVFSQTDVKEYIFLSNATADYLHVLARRDATKWTAIILGANFEHFGGINGGQYYGGDNVDSTGAVGNRLWESTQAAGNGYVWGDIDTGRWYSAGANFGGSQRVMRTFYTSIANGNTGMSGRLDDSGTSEWNGRAPMFPLMSFFDVTGSLNSWMYAGAAPDVRHMFASFVTNGTEFVIGSDTWVFLNNLAFKKTP